jgi:DNA mismatch repair protein MutS
MLDLAIMLEKASPRILILADELCSGTGTIDAISVVGSSIQQLIEKRANFLFTTHLHQLMDLDSIQSLLDQQLLSSLHMATEVKDGRIVYTRKFQQGQGAKSYGIEVAKQLGVGKGTDFIKNALSIRRTLDPLGEPEILTTKQSRYNKDLYMQKCEICGVTGVKKVLHSHHIREQHTADEHGMIDHFHKNIKANLSVLCNNCHKKHHLEGKHDTYDNDL